MKLTPQQARAKSFRDFWQMYAQMRELALQSDADTAQGGADFTTLWTTDQITDSLIRMAKTTSPKTFIDHLFGCNYYWATMLNGIDAPKGKKVFRQESNEFLIESLPMVVGEIEYAHQDRTAIYCDIIPPAPVNLIRYAWYQRDALIDAEKQRIVEILSSWILSTEDGYKPLRAAPELRGAELSTQVALQFAEIPEPPRPIYIRVQNEKEAEEAAWFLYGEQRNLIIRWCFEFAHQTSVALVKAFRPKRNEHIGLPDKFDLERALPVVDPIQRFHTTEEARYEVRRQMERFTEREQQAMLLKAAGMSETQIAQNLGVSRESANEYLDRARQRARGELPPSKEYRMKNRPPKKKLKVFFIFCPRSPPPRCL